MIRELRLRFKKLRIFLNPLSLAALALYVAGCAGPSTPLGAVWATHPSEVNRPRLAMVASVLKQAIMDAEDPEKPSVHFFPSRQVLHGPTPLTLVVYDPSGFNSEQPYANMTMRHNGLDVTKSFLMQAKVRLSKNRIFLRFPVLRLDPTREHVIEVLYGNSGHHAYARLLPPSCNAWTDHSVHSTDEFRPTPLLMRQIHELARQQHFSPAFVAALIAQESGFDPHRVSWARAMGLTQVTPVAEGELSDKFPEFAGYPRFPGISGMPYLWIQALVSTGQINGRNEWRVDPGRSIRGGLAYLEILSARWTTKENRQRILKVYGEEDYNEALTRLVLASYNSGYARVWSALSRFEYSWPTAPELTEARKYVGRVFSYCEHFSEPEPVVKAEEIPELYHENET
jgi:hypothetical protein